MGKTAAKLPAKELRKGKILGLRSSEFALFLPATAELGSIVYGGWCACRYGPLRQPRQLEDPRLARPGYHHRDRRGRDSIFHRHPGVRKLPIHVAIIAGAFTFIYGKGLHDARDLCRDGGQAEEAGRGT